MADEEHLAILEQGVKAWNAWRKENPGVRPDLHEAYLHGADLTDFTEKDLETNRSEAHLGGTILRVEADLADADLGDADLRRANLPRADLHGAYLGRAYLSGANLHGANLTGANLHAANLSGANLSGASLHETYLRETDLSDCNLRGASGICLDDSYIRGARFSANSKDSWSVLRRSYTGLMFLFHLIFLVAFLGAYSARSAVWLGVNRTQEALAASQERLITHLQSLPEQRQLAMSNLHQDLRRLWTEKELDGEVLQDVRKLTEQAVRDSATHLRTETLAMVAQELRNIKPCLQEDCKPPQPVWQVLLRVGQGWLLAVALVVYNILRGLLTRRVSLLRDEEERSGHSPLLKEYVWLYRAHFWVMRPLVLVALAALLVNGWELLVETTVILPA